MEELKEISINQLPSKTWHWLKVNDTKIRWGEESVPCRINYEDNSEDPSGSDLQRMEICDGDGEWSSGMRTVVLTIVISAVAAWLKPIKTEDDGTA